jgi:hypothetical protein
MDKEFETWWTINKFRLMENEAVGLREIALAAYTAGKQAAQQSVHPTLREPAECECGGKYYHANCKLVYRSPQSG